ncbi:hypothetical protein EV356DRAFT_535336 [Viridothelium virens]|uniref:DUF1772-domain-containing protein n=1 Tax=Viridothelium virens TaxID=1048519 RepID=A0A6A6H105_VIRVR|nr:hypothetical protein EV356DRAFT_535336 [Viridothelium virens]
MASAQYLSSPHSGDLQALKGLAIAGSLWNAGSMTTAYRLLPSIYPSVQTSRKLATKQWAFYYQALSKTVPVTDLATILICSGLAYVERKENKAALGWKLWATAASIMPFGWVWVWTLMLEPSNRLLSISEAQESVVDEKEPEPLKAISLLKEFNSLMGVRMLFPWVVGGLALWASLNE